MNEPPSPAPSLPVGRQGFGGQARIATRKSAERPERVFLFWSLPPH
ncbi:MAG: hypothetical protein HY001_02050 [Candidatus Portnoybacteria bacterium]|nr:hypothetical protein [Candidatus Portnoybacteria bacterium]